MRKRVIGLLVGAGMFFAAGAQAQTWNNQDLCSMGMYQVCANVYVFYSADGKLNIRVENLGGTVGLSHDITALGLYHLGSNWTGTISAMSVSGTGNTSGWAYVPPANTEIKGPNGGPKVDYQIELAADRNGVPGITSGQILTFTFTLSTPFVIDDNTHLRWHSQVVGADGEPSTRCDTGGLYDDDPEYGPCSVVPEPVSMVLLGSGLAGLGGVGALRRRRKGLDVVNA